MNLTIKQPTTSTSTASACVSYAWNGTTYNTSGTYTWSGINAAGCDSTATLNLTINTPTLWYVDADNDGFGNQAISQSACSMPSGYVSNSTDCNDSDANMNATYSFYADTDADGYGAGVLVSLCAVNSTTPPSGYVTNNTDCAPADAAKWQLATFYVDADADGYDNGSASVCSGVGAPAGYSATTLGTDCNDNAYSESNTCGGGSVVNLTMFIEGYYLGGNTMNSVKFNQDGVSPTTDVEDITVNLHDATTYALLYTAVGTLHTDGHLSVTFNTAAAGSYYVAVKGVNVVETWSADPQAIGTTPLNYDFSSAATQAYGSNMRDDDLATGVYLMYQGDINQDGGVDNSDGDPLFIDIENFNYGELATDLTGDGGVDNSDADILLRNSDNFIYSNHP